VLLKLSAEWRRLLAPHGTLAVELGDTYAGSGGAGGDYGQDGLRSGQERYDGSARRGSGRAGGEDGQSTIPGRKHYTVDKSGTEWPLAKSLTLVPEAYRFALAYGINPHTGVESPAGRWRVRNVVRWVRPNPPVGALGDKFRPATSELVVACTSGKRWFDLDAVREPSDYHRESLYTNKETPPGQRPNMSQHTTNPAGAPPLDWWKISPKGYAGAHYAVWPAELCVKPIEAMCPREVCRECGQPRERVVGEAEYERTDTDRVPARLAMTDGSRRAEKVNQFGMDNGSNTSVVRNAPTLGWSDCGHDNYRHGLVLDPFAGTGTTLAVAHGHSRDAIGIDLDSRNAELARDRVGPMFLQVEQ